MKPFILFLCISYVNCFYIGDNASSKEKIVEGYAVYSWYKNYQAFLEYQGDLICGAVIISLYHLLSAAHCLAGLINPLTNVKIRAGTDDRIRQPGEVFDLTQYMIHDDFANSRFAADIVLLWASLRFRENIFYIRMVNMRRDPNPGSRLVISGFGKTDELNSAKSPVLKEASVYVVPKYNCPWEAQSSPNVICASSFPNDKCDGDAGGPGVINDKLAAIISSERPCGNHNTSGVYMDVGAFYSWIMEKGGSNLRYYQHQSMKPPKRYMQYLH